MTMPNENDSEYVSREEAARLLGLSAPQVSRLLKAGILRGLPAVGVRVSLESIEACKELKRPAGWPKGKARKPEAAPPEQPQ